MYLCEVVNMKDAPMWMKWDRLKVGDKVEVADAHLDRRFMRPLKRFKEEPVFKVCPACGVRKTMKRVRVEIPL